MAPNRHNLWQFLGSTIGRIIILGIVILFLYNIGRLIYKNYQINNQIDGLKMQISRLEEEKIDLANRIIYYQTDTYKELELRQHLGYKKPGEKFVVLYKGEKKDNPAISDDIDNYSNKLDDKKENSLNIPNWQKWWEFIFG